LPVIGFLGGVFCGVSGAYGPFTTTSLILAKGGHPRYAIGTANLVEVFVAMSVFTTLVSGIGWGTFQWELTLALVAGSVVTAPLGAALSRHLPVRILGMVIGAMLVGINAWTISQEVM
jgi:uncharacterized membrane protein YfcA